MDLKTDLLPSLKKNLSIIKFLRRPPHYHSPALSSYTRYCNFSDDYKIHPCMMYYYCCYCYNDYEQKTKCVF